MARRRKTYLGLALDTDDLACGIAQDNTYTDTIELIRQIDAQHQDWTFTRMLKGLVDELMAEEEGTRVDSGSDHIKGI